MLPSFILFRRSSFCCLHNFSISSGPFFCCVSHFFYVGRGIERLKAVYLSHLGKCVCFHSIEMRCLMGSGQDFLFNSFRCTIIWQDFYFTKLLSIKFRSLKAEGNNKKWEKCFLRAAVKVLQHRIKCIWVHNMIFFSFFCCVFPLAPSDLVTHRFCCLMNHILCVHSRNEFLFFSFNRLGMSPLKVFSWNLLAIAAS